MEGSITLGITISITIRLQPGITETPRVMDTGESSAFLECNDYLILFHWFLDSILLGKLQ